MKFAFELITSIRKILKKNHLDIKYFNKMEGFGVIVICTKNDLLFAKGCCASVRYFLGPDVPICILKDGNFSLQGLDLQYKAIVLDRKSIKSSFLRNESFGWGKTKMITFWESPFEYFLWLDADTCVWGDVRKYADFENFDLIIDQPNCTYKPDDIDEFFFNQKWIRDHYPTFNLEQHNQCYFCTGVLFSKKGVFEIEEYKEIIEKVKKHPNMFRYGEMGFLNYMIFSALQKGMVRVKQVDFQYLVPDYPIEETESRFSFDQEEYPIVDTEPTVLHYCGNAKPIVQSPHGYWTYPMTYFRRDFYKKKGTMPWRINVKINKEDLERKFRLQSTYYFNRIKQLW